jgi:hypothetical protein
MRIVSTTIHTFWTLRAATLWPTKRSFGTTRSRRMISFYSTDVKNDDDDDDDQWAAA